MGRPRSGQAVVRGPVAVSYLLRAWSAQAPAHPRGALPSSLSMPGARSLTTTPAPGLWPCCVASCPGRCRAEVWREAWCGDELRRGSRSAQPTARPSRPFPHGCARLLSLTSAGAFPAAARGPPIVFILFRRAALACEGSGRISEISSAGAAPHHFSFRDVRAASSSRARHGVPRAVALRSGKSARRARAVTLVPSVASVPRPRTRVGTQLSDTRSSALT